jgi:hypothetical protein
MTLSDFISIIGTIITIIGMILTIIYANRAKSYKEQIQFDIRKINLSGIVDKLKRIQDEVRKLPKTLPPKRGVKVDDILTIIKSHFDYILNLLDSDGPDIEIKTFIKNAQSSLNSYEISFSSGQANDCDVVKLTEYIQEAISKSNTKILILEKDL